MLPYIRRMAKLAFFDTLGSLCEGAVSEAD